MNFVVARVVSPRASRASRIRRRLTDKCRELRCLTPQERADRYVAHMPTAVLGR